MLIQPCSFKFICSVGIIAKSTAKVFTPVWIRPCTFKFLGSNGLNNRLSRLRSNVDSTMLFQIHQLCWPCCKEHRQSSFHLCGSEHAHSNFSTHISYFDLTMYIQISQLKWSYHNKLRSNVDSTI